MKEIEFKKMEYLEKIKDTMLAYYDDAVKYDPLKSPCEEAANHIKKLLIQDIAHDAGLIIARNIYGNLTLIPEDGLDV